MPLRQWTLPRAHPYGRVVGEGRVVMVGALRQELEGVLRDRYGAMPLDDLDARAAAEATVAVTSGVWGSAPSTSTGCPDSVRW